VPASQLTTPVAALMLKQMIMPVLAICLSGFFQGVYAWRSYFLIYREEDYVELAKAKGLVDRRMEWRYILRPALPYVLTSFALVVIGSWQAAIALEKVFYWPGVGVLFLGAVNTFNTPLILGVAVVFAYMLAMTLFLVDIACALVDPRVRLGGGRPTLRAVSPRRAWSRRRDRPTEPAPPPSATPVAQGSRVPAAAPGSAVPMDPDPPALPATRREHPSPRTAASDVAAPSCKKASPRARRTGTSSANLVPLLLHRARPRDEGEDVKACYKQQQRLDAGHEGNGLKHCPNHRADHVGSQSEVFARHNGKGANKYYATEKCRDGSKSTHDQSLGSKRQEGETGQVDKV
jgi:hypothetical protein